MKDEDNFNPIFWKASQFDLLTTGGFYLRPIPARWAAKWTTAESRAATWARLRHRQTGTTILHINTHFDHISEGDRIEGSKRIIQQAADLRVGAEPILITGDFNCNPWAPDYGVPVETTFTDACHRLFLAQGYVDTYLEAGNMDGIHSNTCHGFEGDAYSATRHHLAWRIDWILRLEGTPKLQTRACQIIRDAARPIYPSDHYQVVATLTILETSR